MGYSYAPGVNAYEIDCSFDCVDCKKSNEDIACWVEGDEVTHVCEHCGYENTVSL